MSYFIYMLFNIHFSIYSWTSNSHLTHKNSPLQVCVCSSIHLDMFPIKKVFFIHSFACCCSINWTRHFTTIVGMTFDVRSWCKSVLTAELDNKCEKLDLRVSMKQFIDKWRERNKNRECYFWECDLCIIQMNRMYNVLHKSRLMVYSQQYCLLIRNYWS